MLFALGAAIRCIWAFIIPPWTGPDEGSHFTYVAYIVENGTLPQYANLTKNYPDQPRETSDSCVKTLCNKISALAAPHLREINYLPVTQDFSAAREYRTSNPEERKSLTGSNATSYPPLYYLLMTPFYWAFQSAPVVARLLAVRVATAFVSALACVFAYLMAYEGKRDRWFALQVGLLLALFPMLSFVSAGVNNDGLMIAATSAVCWLTLKLANQSATTLANGALLGLAASTVLLTKPTGGLVVVMALAFLGIKVLFERGTPFLAKFRGVALCSVMLLLFEGAWLVSRKVHAQAGVSAPNELNLLQVLQGESAHSFRDYLKSLFVDRGDWYFWFLFKSFWANFGWQEIQLRESYYRAAFIVCGVGALAFLIDVLRRRVSVVDLWSFLTVVVHVAGLFVAADYLLAFATRGGSYGMQGRYFFPVLAPAFYVLLSGMQSLFGERRYLLRLLPLAMLVFQIASLATVVDAYYGVDIE